MSKSGVCTYCAKFGVITRDHVPPRGFFPTPPPLNLITVPSCRPCNNENAKEDEYLRTVLVLNPQTRGNHDREKIAQKIQRSLNREKYGGLRGAVFRTTREVQKFTPSGLYVETAVQFRLDIERMTKIAARITKGLYFHFYHHRLPEEHVVQAHSLRVSAQIDKIAPGLGTLNEEWRVRFGSVAPVIRYGTAFTCWHEKSPYEDATVWMFSFFGQNEFVVRTFELNRPQIEGPLTYANRDLR